MNELVFNEKQTNQKEFEKKIEASIKKGPVFFVAFGADGEPFDIIEGPGCKVLAEGTNSSANLIKVLQEIGNPEKKTVEAICCSLLHVHASPGCYIMTASGRLKCICCR